MPSIFVIEGMTFMIPKFTLTMGDDGSISGDMKVEPRYDACTAWAAVALEHRARTNERLEARRRAWSTGGDEAQKGPTLEGEFRSAMQAVVAAATSLDALYDVVKKSSPVPEATRAAWYKNRTARHTQIAETLRAAFKIRPAEAKPLKQNLRAMYVLRDAAVHPSGVGHPPVPHPELDVSTEWRLTSFRAEVADMMVCCAIGVLWDLSRGTKYRSDELTNYMKGLRARLDQLLPEGRPKPPQDTVNFYLPPRRTALVSRA